MPYELLSEVPVVGPPRTCAGCFVYVYFQAFPEFIHRIFVVLLVYFYVSLEFFDPFPFVFFLL